MSFNILDSTYHETKFNNSIIRLATSFGKKNLYVLSSDSQLNDHVFFNESLDNGKTFNSIELSNLVFNKYDDIKLYTDHLDNIFIYDSNHIYMSKDNGKSWINITPTNLNLITINELRVSHDNYIYVSNLGAGILKYPIQIESPRLLIVKSFNDENDNCLFDISEEPVSNIKVIIDNNYFDNTDKKGIAKFILQKGIYNVNLLYNNELYKLCNTSYSIDLVSNMDTTYLYVPTKVLKYCADMKIAISNTGLRRCDSNNFTGNITNYGSSTTYNNKILLKFDKFLKFQNSSLNILNQNDTIIELDCGNIEPGNPKFFDFNLEVSCKANYGQTHCISVELFDIENNCNNNSDYYYECKQNKSSFDPNNKTIIINGETEKSKLSINDKIEYQINFQNIGNDTAYHVRIEDPILDKLNFLSISPLVASHNYRWKIENKKLIIDFDNIKLVDSIHNELMSHGYIKFSIKLDTSVNYGDIIENQAIIYFDNNDPILTNLVSRKLELSVDNQEINISEVKLYPNPTENYFNFYFENLNQEKSSITILNNIGKCIMIKESIDFQSIDLSQYPTGIYYILIKSKNKTYNGKVVKI